MQDKFDFTQHFPENFTDPRVAPLQSGNEIFRSGGQMFFEPQHPHYMVINCGKLAAERVLNIKKLGVLFDVAKRGVMLSEEDIGSIEYASTHFDIDFCAVIVHACVADGSCRVVAARNARKPLNADLRSMRRWQEGVKVVQMDRASEVPPADFLHGFATAAKVLEFAPITHARIVQGKLLLGMFYYNNSTGELISLGFITSNAPEHEISKEILTDIAQGKQIDSIENIDPKLADLHALVVSNREHMANFKRPVPTEYVIFGCADSRTSPYIIFNAPDGLLEIVRNAGNVVNEEVLHGIRIAVEDALHLRKQISLVILGHSRCGAVTEALSTIGKNVQVDNLGLSALLARLHHRFAPILHDEPEHFAHDEKLIQAAALNAVAAGWDIIETNNPDAEYLRQMISEQRLSIFPAEYLLKSGQVIFGRPIEVPAAEMRMAAN